MNFKQSPFLDSFTFWTAAVALFMAGLVGGCSNSSINEIEDLETVSLYSNADQLAQTMEYIRSTNRYEMANFRDKVNSGLNRWATSTDVDLASSWKLPELASSLPEPIRGATIFNNLDDVSFFANDADYVQQIFWLKKVADRIAASNYVFHHEYLFQTARNMADEATLARWQENPDDLLTDAMKLLHPELAGENDAENSDEVTRLTQAIKLFDWSVRNVHLLEARQWPDSNIIEDEALVLNAKADAFPPSAGAPGPGYIRYPWQILTYAKGDYLERAQIFAGLCNQVDIPVVVLAIPPQPEDKGRPYQEWLCAVLIGDQAYLFDPLLGLPVFGERAGSIATLKEVKENPELLSSLSLTVEESVEKIEYSFSADQLENLTALIVAPPESIARRMTALEDNLTGDSRLDLTIDVDELGQKLGEVAEIKDVQLWHAPFSNALFREQVAVANATRFDQDISSRLRWLDIQERYVDLFVQFRSARNCYLQGIFRSDKERDIRSALSFYYSFMYTDEEIGYIDTDELKQRSLGILRDLNQSFAEWQAQLAYMKQNMTLIRADAAFFLALCNYENNMPSTSLKWFTRVRNYDDDRRWATYIPYHAGRAHESSGDYQKAAESYGKDESAQKHGSLLRQRMMKQLIERLGDGS